MQLDREVAVGVVHDAERNQFGGVEPGLFVQFASGRGFRRLAPFDLPARKLPEPRKKSGVRPLLHEPAFPVRDHHDRAPKVRSRLPGRDSGERSGVVELAERAAHRSDGALRAARVNGKADRFSQFHDGLIEGPRPP